MKVKELTKVFKLILRLRDAFVIDDKPPLAPAALNPSKTGIVQFSIIGRRTVMLSGSDRMELNTFKKF